MQPEGYETKLVDSCELVLIEIFSLKSTSFLLRFARVIKFVGLMASESCYYSLSVFLLLLLRKLLLTSAAYF